MIGDALGDANADLEKMHERISQMNSFTLPPHLQPLLGNEMTEGWLGLSTLLRRPWFRRIWIIQELVMARSSYMLSGDRSMDTAVVLNAGALMSRVLQLGIIMHIEMGPSSGEQSSSLACVNALAMLTGSFWQESEQSIQDLLLLTLSFEASDPRDRIFALVGLTDDVPQEFIDYSRSRTSISTDLATLLLEVSFPTDILGCTWIVGSIDGGPSWIPDWTKSQSNPLRPLFTLVGSAETLDLWSHSVRVGADNVRWASDSL
jgi:hypothetical protein